MFPTPVVPHAIIRISTAIGVVALLLGVAAARARENQQRWRGGMDASQLGQTWASALDYVLVLLFVKYVSDKYADQPGAPIEVPPGDRFADMAALKGRKENGASAGVQAHRLLRGADGSSYAAVAAAS